jgi:hypothetical protein
MFGRNPIRIVVLRNPAGTKTGAPVKGHLLLRTHLHLGRAGLMQQPQGGNKIWRTGRGLFPGFARAVIVNQ